MRAATLTMTLEGAWDEHTRDALRLVQGESVELCDAAGRVLAAGFLRLDWDDAVGGDPDVVPVITWDPNAPLVVRVPGSEIRTVRWAATRPTVRID